MLHSGLLVETHDLFEAEVLPRECLILVQLSPDSFVVVNRTMYFDGTQS
jgi:hypothetical protein